MTTKQLSDLKSKFEQKQGDINDVGLLLCELFQSVSSHLKEIKQNHTEIKQNMEIIYDETLNIRDGLNPVYTIIHQPEDD